MARKRVTQGHMEPIARPVRIGFLVPPGNPTVEVEMIALAPPAYPGILETLANASQRR